jgi:3-phenylpropionate/cinnamic acid dioxygenase small subunit
MRIICLLAAMTALLAASAQSGTALAGSGPSGGPTSSTGLADRAQIEDVIFGFANEVDARRWDAAQALLAGQVELGFPAGDAPPSAPLQTRTLSAGDFIAASQSQLPGFLHTQHMVTNAVVTVDQDRATVRSQMQISHYLPTDSGESYWIVVGTYDYGLVRTPAGWKIARMDVHKLFELGNRKLPDLAAQRVRAGQIATTP